MTVLADRLLTGVKRRVTIPANQNLWNDDDILAAADDSISLEIIPLILSVRQEYFVTVHTENTVADQARYNIPHRAIARIVL